MATLSQILGFVQTGSANVSGYTVYPQDASGVNDAFVKLETSGITRYYAFSLAVLRKIALADESVVPSSDDTNIERYDPSGSSAVFVQRYSRDAKGVLQYEDAANVLHYLFYPDPTVTGTTIQTFTTDTTRYSSSTSFSLTVVNPDDSQDTFLKTANTNIIQPVGTGETIFVVYDDLGFLQAATEKIVGTDGITRDVVPGDGIVKYIKPDGSVEYYKKGALYDGSGAVTGSLPFFKQVNRNGPGDYSDFTTPITWREYGTPDPISKYQFANNSAYLAESTLVSGGYVNPSSNNSSVETVRTFYKLKTDLLSEQGNKFYDFTTTKTALTLYEFTTNNITYQEGYELNYVDTLFEKISAYVKFVTGGQGVSKKIRENYTLTTAPFTFYVFNETAKVQAAMQSGSKVPTGSIIHYTTALDGDNLETTYSEFIKRYVAALQYYNGPTESRVPEWEVYTYTANYSALGTVVVSGTAANFLYNNDTIYVRSANPIAGQTPYPNALVYEVKNKTKRLLQLIARNNAMSSNFDYVGDLDVATTSTVSENAYLTFNTGVSESEYATEDAYAEGELRQRGSAELNAANDIIITKLTKNVVNTTEDQTYTHAYSNRGLYWASKLASGAALRPSGAIKEVATTQATYNYIVQYVLQDANNDYYEYNGLATITLLNFTDLTGETLSGVSVSYPVMRTLYKRTVAENGNEGSPVAAYKKVIEQVSYLVDSTTPHQFYTFRVDATTAAINEDLTYIPVSSRITQNVSDDEAQFIKQSIGASLGSNNGADFDVFSYEALASLVVSNSNFVDTKTAYFMPETKTYIKDASNVIVESTLPKFVAYDGAVTRKQYATSAHYAIGGELRQRSSTQFVNVPETDVVYDKLGISTAQRNDSNLVKRSVNGSYDPVSFAYGDLGLLIAAQLHPANANTIGEVAVASTVRKVTEDEYSTDAPANYHDYVKYAENILKDGNTIYMEYFDLAALTIRDFVNSVGATYNVGDQLKQMNTTTGVLVNTFNKIAAGIALDTNVNKYYEYVDLANAANTENSVIDREATIVDALLDNNVPVGRTSYTKKARALLYQIGTYGWDFFAYDQIGLRAAVLPDANDAAILQNDNRVSIILRNPDSTTTTYYHGGQENLLLTNISSNKQYISYRDVSGLLSEEGFAVANAASGNAGRNTCTFSAGDQLLQRELSSNTELNPTVDNITANKLAVKVVNISTEAGSTHVWEASGSQNGLLNAAQLPDGSVASSITGDFEIHTSIKVMSAGPTEYTRVQQYLLSLTGASPAEYFEFNAFVTLSLQTFTQDNSTYPVETVLRKMDTTTGAQVQYYVKKIENVTKEDNLNNFFVFDNTGKVNAIVAATTIVDISSTIVDDFNSVTWTKYYIDAAKTGSTWEAYSYPALANVAAEGAFGTNNQVYLKERIDPYTTIHQYQYFASKVLQLNDGSLSNDFIAYGVVSEQQFANGNQYGTSASTLRQRTMEATDASADVVIYKLADKVVNNMSATSETRVWENEVSHPYQGLRNAAILVLGSDDTLNVRSTIIVKSSDPEVSYDYDALYLVKKTGTNEYYEFNARSTVSLNTFTTDDTKYPIVAKMHYMNTTNGDIQTVYNKVINQVSQEDSTNKFYVFNDTGKVAAIMDDTSIVALSSIIYYNESASMTKRHVGAVQSRDTTTSWEAYTLLALAAVSANVSFTSGHQVALNTQTDPITTTTTYDWYASKVLKEQNMSPNNFIAYDGVVSEEQFATVNSYGQTATLNQRASSATTSADDIVITKLDYNLVNISNVSAETHAYGDLGLRNAAIRTDGADIKSNTVREMGANAVYSFIVTYVLQDASNNYYEYNELQTITLEHFTSLSGETLSGVSLEYPVSRVLRKRDVTSGAKINDYTKVMVEGVSQIDSPPNTFYTFSQAAREAAIDENNTIVPSIPPSTVYQTIAGVTTIYYKTAVSTAERPSGPPDYEVGTYYALGQLAVNPDISLNTLIYFTDIDTYYTKVEASVLQLYNSTPGTFVAYDGAVSRETFATGSYNVGAKLIQRSSTQTSPDDAVPTSDIVLDKIAANTVNRATGSLSSVYEAVTYCYAELGLLGAATTSSAKATARLVTATDIDGDATAGVVNYSKIAAGLLKLGADKYYEYADFAALSIRTFATGSSYIVADTLYHMNTTTGVEIKNYIKKMDNVVIESVNSYYYVYDGGIVPPANADESIIPIGAYIIVTAENNEPTVSDVANNAYYKRAISLVQIGTSSAFNAYSELGLRSAVALILTQTQTVYYDSITWTSTASNIAVSGTTYLTYADALGTLSEETFAVSGTYDVGAELKQRTLTTPLSLASTASDVSIQKLAVQVVNTSADSVATHAWEVAGSKNGLKNAAQLEDSTAVKAVIKDMSNDVSYDRLERYLLQEQTAIPKYFEYNNQSTLSLQTFTETSSYIVSSELHLMNISTGVETEYYIKVIAKVSQKAGTFDYYVFSEDGKIAAIVDNGDIVPDNSAVHYVPSAELWYRRHEGVAQSGDVQAKWEAYGYLALARASSDSNFTTNHYVQFKEVATPYTLLATYDFFALKVLKLQSATDFITYDAAGVPVVSEEQFAVGISYGNVAILRQRLVGAESDASDNIIYKLADKVVNNISTPTETHVWEVAGGKDGLKNAAQLAQVNGGANVDEVKATIVVMTDIPTTLYTYKEQNLLQKVATIEYYEFNSRLTLSLESFTETQDATYIVSSVLHYMNATTGVEDESYTKVISKVSKETSSSIYKVFSEDGKVAAIVDNGAIVHDNSTIYYVSVDETWKRRHEGVAQSDDTQTIWEAYGYLTLARASSDSNFTTSHYVQFKEVATPYTLLATYDFFALKVLKLQGSADFITYDAADVPVVSEEQFAVGVTYGNVAVLRQRVVGAESDASDNVIYKLADKVVNNMSSPSETHVWEVAGGKDGLRNAAQLEQVNGGNNVDEVKATIVVMTDSPATSYIYKERYLLQQATTKKYFEFNARNTLPLYNFTEDIDTTQDLSINLIDFSEILFEKYDVGSEVHYMDANGVENEYYTKVIFKVSKENSTGEFYVFSDTGKVNAIVDDGAIVADNGKINYIKSPANEIWYRRHEGVAQSGDTTTQWEAYSILALARTSGDSTFASGHNVKLNSATSPYATITSYNQVALKVIQEVSTYNYIAYDGTVSEAQFAKNLVRTYGDVDANPQVAEIRQRASLAEDITTDVIITKLDKHLVNTSADTATTHAYGNLGLRNAARRLGGADLNVSKNIIDKDNADAAYAFKVQYVLADASDNYYVYEDVLRIDTQNYVTLNNFTVLTAQTLSDGVASASLSYDLEDILYARSATDGSAIHNYTKIMSAISKVDSPVNTFYVYSEADRLRALAEDGTKIPFGPAPPQRSTIRQILSGSDLLYGDETVFYKTAVGTSVDPIYPDVEPDYKVDSYYALGQLVTDASAFKFSIVDGAVQADTVELLLNGVPSGIFRKVADSVIEQVGVTPAVYIAYDGMVSRKRFATNDVSGYSNFPAGFTFAVESTLLQRSTAQTTPDSAAVGNQIELLKIATNAVNRKVGASWDSITYVYGNLGMYGAARASASKSTVQKVTADDVALVEVAGLTSGSVDADVGVDEYSKPSANILLQGSGASAVYREYDQLDTLNMYDFSRTGSYSNGATLKEMSVVAGSEGAEVNSYVKVDFGIMRDDVDQVGETETIYYVYGVIADAANSDYSYVALDANIVDVQGVKTPTIDDLRNHSYIKTSIGLLRKKTSPVNLATQTVSSHFFAYSQLGLRTAVVSVLASGQDVTATTITGYITTVYTYVAANLAIVSGSVQYALGGGAEYLTYSDASGSLSKMEFANGITYAAGAALVQRALSELTVAGTSSDVIIYKLVASVINTSDTSTTYAYGAQGLANAAIYNGETAYSVQSTITAYPASDESSTTVYDYVARYLLKNGNDYYEYSGLSEYTLRMFATNSGATYDVGISVRQMNSSGSQVGQFTKSYADIMRNSANSHFYSYTNASLATIANEALATLAVGTVVWDMASNNTPVSGDVQWTKVRLNVLEAAYSANKQYNIYALASLGLVEFACSASFSNGDRLNDIVGSLVYDRIVRTVLQRTDESVYRTFFSDAFGQPEHLQMKTAATSSSVPVSSTIIRMDASSWTKAATGIMQSQADTGIYKTYQTASTYFLPAETFATSSSYLSGDLLETIADTSANTVNYLKNLDYVIYNITATLYQAYAPDGLKNAAQAEPLIGTRSSSNIYRADATKIETEVSIQDMTGVETYFKPAAYPQNVLQKTATNNYYDYTAGGNFGTFTLATFASINTVGASLTDMTGSGGEWKNEAPQVISQTASSVITYYTYSEGTAPAFNDGNRWVQRNGTVASSTTVVEQFGPDNFTYTLLERGVFLRTIPGVYYAYNITSEEFGLTLNTFANDVLGYPFTTLVDRTSSRLDAVYERTAPGVLSTNGSNTAVDPSGVYNLAYSLAPGEVITESPAGNWPANTTRKTYEVVEPGLLKIVDGSNTTFYVYDTSLITLHDFAVQSQYPIGDTYVDRSSTYNGPLYGKVLDGVLNQRSNEAAIISTEMLTFEDTGVMGLKNASLAEVGDISDGTILIPEVVEEPAYLRSAKGLLKQYNGHASSSGFSLNALAYQLTADDCSNSILAVAALNRGLVASTQIAAETNIYMQEYGATTYNKSVIGYVKDSSPFTNVLRVGTEAISDKISYAPADGTRLANLQNFCELDTSGSLVSENRDPKFGGKTITVMFNDCSAATVYSIARRGLMTNLAGDVHTFSSNGLVSAAAAGDFVLTFTYNFVSAGVETTESFKRVAKGLLLSNSQIGGAAGLNSTTSAILYYSDYSTFADDNLPNMYFYLYKLATQRSVGGATADTATYIRDPSGNWTVSTNTADQVIDTIASGTITTLYSIVQRINVAATTEKYELVQDVSNALAVTNLANSSKFYLAYGSQGLNTTYNGALDGIQSLTLADTVIVPTGSIYYTGDRYSVAYNNANKYTKLGKGLVSGPDGAAIVYSADALRVYANQTLASRSTLLPVGVPGIDTTNSSRTTLGNITYYWWERGVLMYKDADNIQNFEVYPLPVQNLGAVSFIKRFAMARTNTTGVAADYADAIHANAAFINGSKLVIYDASENDVTGDTFYRKVDEGLVQNTLTSTYYAFSDYGLASAANANPTIPSAIAMGSSLDPNTVVSPVWTRQMTGLLRSGTAWTLYTNLIDISAGKQFFAQNSDLSNVMTYKTYSYPNTTTTMTTYTNVVDGSSNGVNTAILFNSPTLGENAYQTFGFAGLALMANSDISNIVVNKSTQVYAYPIVGDASNNVTAGLYRKLQTGAVYDSGMNILLMNRSQFQTVLDRFDIVEFASLAANVNSSIDVSATALNLSPMERFFLNGSSIAGTPFNQTINGTSYSVEQVLERDLLTSGSYNWTTVIPSSATATDDVVSSLTVTNKNVSVMSFRYRRWLRPISIVG